MGNLDYESLAKKRNLHRQYDDVDYLWRRDEMLDFDTYWVHATHPDQPNWDGTSRGRKRHLSKTNIKGKLTLCNMLVDGTFMESIDIRTDDAWGDHWVNNGLCGNCKIAYNRTAKKGSKL